MWAFFIGIDSPNSVMQKPSATSRNRDSHQINWTGYNIKGYSRTLLLFALECFSSSVSNTHGHLKHQPAL